MSLQKIIASIKKLAEAKIFDVRLYNIEWDTDDELVDLPNDLFFNLEANSEEEAISQAIEQASDQSGYLIINTESDADEVTEDR